MRAFIFLWVIIFFSGCSTLIQQKEVSRLSLVSQNPSVYTKDIDLGYINQDDFFDKYYKIWQSGIVQSKNSIAWGFLSYNSSNSYGLNLKPLDSSFFDELKQNANLDEFKSIDKKAITTKYVNLRVFPTSQPVFKNPEQAGEGFPFDYLQNSSVAPNEPIYISHFSKDKEWVYAFSSYASGWIKSDEFAFIGDDEANELRDAKKVFLTKDGISLLDENGNFLFKSRVGMVLVLDKEEDDFYTVFTFANTLDNTLIKKISKIPKELAFYGYARVNDKNLDQLIGELLKNRYGWGGMFEQRDCSSMVRDYFASFGYYLPRNSSAQAKIGEVTMLKGLSDEQKIATIKDVGVPFKTLLYRKGHIVLYVGVADDKIIVLHNTWGIRLKKSGKDGRFIVGKTLFSTLELGSELEYADKSATLLKTIESMNVLK